MVNCIAEAEQKGYRRKIEDGNGSHQSWPDINIFQIHTLIAVFQFPVLHAIKSQPPQSFHHTIEISGSLTRHGIPITTSSHDATFIKMLLSGPRLNFQEELSSYRHSRYFQGKFWPYKSYQGSFQWKKGDLFYAWKLVREIRRRIGNGMDLRGISLQIKNFISDLLIVVSYCCRKGDQVQVSLYVQKKNGSNLHICQPLQSLKGQEKQKKSKWLYTK